MREDPEALHCPAMRVLVGYDGSEGGRDALELTRVLGYEEGGTAIVAATEPLFEEARERLAGLTLETHPLTSGSPAKAIVELAEAERIDAIVVGSPHRGAVGRTFVGSVAEAVLHGAPCPVFVASRGYAAAGHGPFGLVAIAYDGTPEAKAALARARAIAEASGASLCLLTVVAPPVALPGGVGYAPIEPPEPEKVLEEGVREAGGAATVEGRKLDGPPAATLAQACEDADLLVAGSRGYGPVMRVLLGSVSSRLIAEAPCPVLVVPRPRPEP
jgi:nucleotide-binding universal stress UspA family protein